ncbi:MAG: alanine racemase [Halioglobus sp.]|nr:alanine racemase [Halioglobus sp.]
MSRPSQAQLDMDALRNNIAIARALAPRAKLLAVVKANAYGHGALAVARELEARADALAVASLEEAAGLRDGGIGGAIFLLEGVFEPGELAEAAARDLWLAVHNREQLAWLEEARLARPLHCWLKVNTGMNRLGFAPEDTEASYRRLRDCANTTGEPVLFTHLACAEYLDRDTTDRQLDCFEALCAGAPRSAANSPGLLAWPRSHLDWVRPGYMLYGNSPLAEPHPSAAGLQPVMTLTSKVIALRDVAPGETVGYGGTWVARQPSRIATVAIGYGDGYPRDAANGTPVLVGGRRAPLAGRVSMDMITVDVTGRADVGIGTPVELWGRGLPLDDVARGAGASGYELLTRMPGRTPRVCIDSAV